MTEQSDDSQSRISRRKLLGAGSATLAGGLAGCGGDGEPEESPTAPPSPSPRRETVIQTVEGSTQTVIKEKTVKVTDSPEPFQGAELSFDQPVGVVPTDISMGWGGSSGGFGDYWQMNLGQLGFDGNYRYEALEDISLSSDGKTLTMKLRDDLHYHNGEDVTVMSFLHHQRELYWATGGWAGSSLTQQPEMVDDHTARYHFVNPEPSELLILSYYTFGVSYPEPQTLETIQMYKEANSSEERDRILDERTSSVLEQNTLEHKVKAGHGQTGVYKIDSWDDVTDENIFMTKFDEPGGNPYVHERFPDEFTYHFAGGSAAKEQMIINDVTDFGNGAFPKNLESVKPQSLSDIITYPKPRGTVVHFSYADKDLANRNVRRAIISRIDNNNVQAASKDRVIPHTYNVGMTEDLANNFLGKDWVSQQYDYPHRADKKAAADFMQKAGYSKVDGTWLDPDGKETDIVFVAHSNRAVEARAIANPLNNFGLNVELISIGNPDYSNRIREQKDYDMAFWSPYGCFSSAPHPNCFYRVDKHTNLALGSGAKGAADWQAVSSVAELEEGTHYIMKDGQAVSIGNHHPLVPTVPSEFGKLEISGSGEKINLLELDNHLSKDEELTKWSRRGARYYNFDVPNHILYENTGGAWGDVVNFNWPERSNNQAWLMPGAIGTVIRKGQVEMVED